MQDLQQFAIRELGYNFNNIEHLKLALSHKSVGPTNNEKLEFFGDSILSYVISEMLFLHFPKADEGQLTRMRSHLVCRDYLAIVAKELLIQDYIILSVSEKKTGGHQRSSILADALEAIIAAIHTDSSIDITKSIIQKWFLPHIDNLKLNIGKDPKTMLQEYLQSFGDDLPIYEVVSTEGPEHKQLFNVECTIPGTGQVFTGNADSRRKAEQIAAKLALELIQKEKKGK